MLNRWTPVKSLYIRCVEPFSIPSAAGFVTFRTLFARILEQNVDCSGPANMFTEARYIFRRPLPPAYIGFSSQPNAALYPLKTKGLLMSAPPENLAKYI